MSFNSDFEENFNFVINQLRKENNYLTTDLNKYKLLSNCYQKYFEYFDEFIEINDSNNEVLNELKNNIKVINECKNSCFVSLEKLNENQLNRLKSQTNAVNSYLKTSYVSTLSNFNIKEEPKDNYIQSSDYSDNDIDIDSNEEQFSDNDSKERFGSQRRVKSVKKIKGQHICEHYGCGKVFKRREYLLVHRKVHTGVRYHCEREGCSAAYTQKKYLRRHMEKHKVRHHCTHEGCPYSTITLSNLKLHELSHSKQYEIVFKCCVEGCDYIGRERNLLDSHKKKIHLKPFPCSVFECDKRFGTKSNLRRHKSGVHKITDSTLNSDEEVMIESTEVGSTFVTGKDTNLYKDSDERQLMCLINGCNKTIEDMDQLLCHQSEQHSEDLEDSPWIECTQNGCEFRTKLEVQRERHHITCEWTANDSGSNENSKGRDFICQWVGCGASFTTSRGLKEHTLNLHSTPRYPCDWENCNAVLNTSWKLRFHKNIHMRRYSCEWEGCQYVAKEQKHLNAHKLKHSEERRYKCMINDCNLMFKSDAVLKSHEIRVHPQEFSDIPWLQCSESDCNYKTKSKLSLDKHLKIHTRPYNCAECGKCFGETPALKRHLATHSSELKIPCEWYGCERLFTTKIALKYHMNTHTFDKTYACDWPGCDKSYITPTSLSKHMKKQHGRRG